MVQLGFSQIYLLDTCCITRLDRKDRHNYDPPTFDDTERALIWDGLEHISDEGRLKIIQPVKDELNRLHPNGLKRLAIYPAHRLLMRRTAPENVSLYRELMTKYPDIAPKPGGAEGDPWLLVAASRFRFTIVTMELRLHERSPKARKKLRIPDICDREDLECLSLRELANHEGWLTSK